MVVSVIKMKLTRVKKAKLHRFILGKKTFDEIGKIASAAIVLNIKRGQQADGSPIKENADSTKLRKRVNRRLWRGKVQPLIDSKKHRFIKTKGGSWRWFAYSGYVDIEPATGELERLSKYVQAMGYVGWFDVNKKGWFLIRKVVKQRLFEILGKKTKVIS